MWLRYQSFSINLQQLLPSGFTIIRQPLRNYPERMWTGVLAYNSPGESFDLLVHLFYSRKISDTVCIPLENQHYINRKHIQHVIELSSHFWVAWSYKGILDKEKIFNLLSKSLNRHCLSETATCTLRDIPSGTNTTFLLMKVADC